MAMTPKAPSSVELFGYEKRLIQSLKEVREGATVTCKDTYVLNLCRDLLSKMRLACIRQLLAIIYDAKKRGTPKANALAFADEWKAVIDSMYGDEGMLNSDAVDMAEEVAEGAHEIAQRRLIQEKSGPAAQAFLSANRVYEVANDGLKQFARGILTGARA